MEQCESAAALLESVREQEVQFEQLTRALEEERRRVGLPATSPSALGRPHPHMQVTVHEESKRPPSIAPISYLHTQYMDHISSNQSSVNSCNIFIHPSSPRSRLLSTSARQVCVLVCLCVSSSFFMGSVSQKSICQLSSATISLCLHMVPLLLTCLRWSSHTFSMPSVSLTGYTLTRIPFVGPCCGISVIFFSVPACHGMEWGHLLWMCCTVLKASEAVDWLRMFWICLNYILLLSL